jgi:hypothetical protein
MPVTGHDILTNANLFRAAAHIPQDLSAIELARFRAKVDKNGPVPSHRPELGPCWVWTGATRRDGYGVVTIRQSGFAVHRVSFEMHHTPIPVGLRVLHHCDNRPCVNPTHLFTGTARDNMQDMMQKGRGSYIVRRGEESNFAKLTEAQVRLMFAMRAEGAILAEIARAFSCSIAQVSSILRREAWAHIPGLVADSPSVLPCGTPAAYRRHYKKGEKPCQACREGYNASRRNRSREDLP